MTDTPQPVDYQLARQASHTSLLNVAPRGDDQIHIVDFLRSTSENKTSTDDLLLRLREVMTADVIAKRSVTNNATSFFPSGNYWQPIKCQCIGQWVSSYPRCH
jgi:hypothetical protein